MVIPPSIKDDPNTFSSESTWGWKSHFSYMTGPQLPYLLFVPTFMVLLLGQPLY